jgi:histidine triad (HIT) family protein
VENVAKAKCPLSVDIIQQAFTFIYIFYIIIQMKECIFCGIAAGKIQSQIIYQDDDIVAFKDLNPQAPAHILIIPIKHIESLASSSEEDCVLLGKLQLAAAKIAKELGLKDFRLVANNGKGAGQSVFHLHYHLMGGRRFMWPAG